MLRSATSPTSQNANTWPPPITQVAYPNGLVGGARAITVCAEPQLKKLTHLPRNYLKNLLLKLATSSYGRLNLNG